MYEPTLKELISMARELAIRLDCEKVENTLQKKPKSDKYSRWDLTKLIVGKNIREYYGDNIPKSAIYVNRFESAMMCARFPELKPELQQELLKDNNEFYAEEKFNGHRCLCGETLVVLEDGTTDTIKNIVDNKLQVRVLSYNHETQKVEPKRITGWFKNPDRISTDWCRLRGASNSNIIGYIPTQKNYITKDHKIFSEGKYKEVQIANTVNSLYRTLSKTQWDILYGILLGDGWIYKDNRSKEHNTCIKFSHSVKQEDYFHKLRESLMPFIQESIRHHTSGYGSEILTGSTSALIEFNALDRDTIIDKEILSVLSIAIWYMDDGHMNQSNLESSYISNTINRPTFNTHRYSIEQVKKLQILLENSVGLKTTVQQKDNGLILVGSSSTSMQFYERISKYIPESMSYKVPKILRSYCGEIEWWNDDTVEYCIREQEIRLKLASETPQSPRMIECYDIEVEDNHNYFANGFLVHNCKIFFSPEEGFKFYANNRDTDSLLVSDNTEQIVLIKNGIESLPKDFIGKSDSTFVFDAEVICDSKYVDATSYGGVMTESELNAVGTLMQLDPESSKEIQRTQKGCQLRFMIFDILYMNRDLMNEPLFNRNKIRDVVLKKLECWNLPFYNVPRTYINKQGLFDTLTENGKEGIVIKNDKEIYTPNKTRNKLRQIKYKRTISGMLGDDIDCFIIGFEPSTEGKAFENYIGAIKLGVYMNTVEGNEVLHHIASISGMPLELRKKMSVINKNTGKPELNQEYMNRVLTIDGFSITKGLKFSHARVEDWNTCWRTDKTPEMCEINEEILRMQIL